jgi:ATP-dependent DNA helicase DinG
MLSGLAETIPGFEERTGQNQMATAVEKALREEEHLAVEAPCGVGKTFAYLLPAIRHAIENDTRVIVCTANIALQEQIISKDLPALEKAVQKPFRYELIKGIGNYLCLDRAQDLRHEEGRVTFDRYEKAQWKKISRWAEETRSGDVSDLPFEPAPGVWGRVKGISEFCTGIECHHFDDCFAMEARRRLRDAQIIVTNYHLFFAHLRLKAAAKKDVILPSYSAVICDEAHELADITREFFGLRLGPSSIYPLLRGANHFQLGQLSDRLKTASRAFFDEVDAFARSDSYKNRLRTPGYADGGALAEAVSEYRGLLANLRKGCGGDRELDKIRKHDNVAVAYEETLSEFLRMPDENMVYWIQRNGGLSSRLIDPSEILKSSLFDQCTVIMTSATLAPFDLLQRETGATPVEMTTESPFHFPEQAQLIIPHMRNRPGAPGYLEEMNEGIHYILKSLRGRTMCLFTSYRNLDACAQAAESTGIRILRQGDKPRTKLLEEFRTDPSSALFATASFWQGVDIPGEALSCLVIDKLPFLPPSDPLLDALQEKDPRAFLNFSLPKAVLALRQGFGRLIRSKTDRGVVVIFDHRLLSARYGRDFLRALPPCPVHRNLEELENFISA